MIQTASSQFGWYAVRVKSNRESIVAASLGNRGYEAFLPVYRVRRQWSDRVMDVELPLFAGYVFCRLDPRARLPVLTIPGVVLFVGFGHHPARIDDAEIANLQTIASACRPAAPWPFLRAGRRVRLEQGPLKGLEGFLIEVKNRYRLVVSVTLLQRSVAVEVDRDSISPLATHSGAKSTVVAVGSLDRVRLQTS